MAMVVRDQLRRAGDCLLLVADSGMVTYASPHALAVLGLTPEVVVDQPLQDVAQALDSDELLALASAITQGQPAARCFACAGRAGAGIDVVALPADEGVAVFVAPALLHHADEQDPAMAMLEKVLATANDAVLVTTAEPTERPGPVIVYANDALQHHTGYSLDELLGRSPRLLQGPDTDPAELRRLNEALAAWRPIVSEVLNYRKDGSTFWVEMNIAPLADATGWFTHWVSVQRDVTARKLRELADREQSSIVQAILDSIPSQAAMLDQSGVIVAVNQPWHDYWAMGTTAPEPDWSTVNYLEACDNAVPPLDLAAPEALSDPQAAAAGIRSVLSGAVESFAMDYECLVGRRVYWFHLHVSHITDRPGAVVTHSDITERKQAEILADFKAVHDELTELPNRVLIARRLEEILEGARGTAAHTAVIFMSLDSFKDVNYAYGHAVGDEMLQVVGLRLQHLRERPTEVGRFGGDEFVVLLSDLDSAWNPDPLLASLREQVCQPIEIGMHSLRPSISFGVVVSPPHEGSADAMLRDADTAAYASKAGGRDRWTVFSEDIRRQAIARATSEQRISEALRNDDFVLHFQPVVDVCTGRTVGSEALLRLQEPGGILLGPADFLPVVESGPLAEEVGLWVLDHALAVQAAWQSSAPDHRISVNVSPRQFGHGRLPDQVAAALQRHGVPAARLVLEITEDVLLEGGGVVAEELDALVSMGVLIAMDDFGTGYSSLAYLQRFPIRILKIDRSFLGMTHGNREGLLAAITSLCKAVDAITVVEGVETPEQLDLVRRIGAQNAQGYLLGRPVPPGVQPSLAPLEALLRRADELSPATPR
jgi:diguanylate cyclase (GGDEF)-like protein/PAS domain S-box-containing protein